MYALSAQLNAEFGGRFWQALNLCNPVRLAEVFRADKLSTHRVDNWELSLAGVGEKELAAWNGGALGHRPTKFLGSLDEPRNDRSSRRYSFYMLHVRDACVFGS